MSKFEVGEVCLVAERTGASIYGECQIVEVNPTPMNRIEIKAKLLGISSMEYSILIEGSRSRRHDGSWLIEGRYLKKKKPPKQLDDKEAEDRFINNLKASIFGEEIIV